MINSDILINWEAEKATLGFLLNPYVEQKAKDKFLVLLYGELYSNSKYLKVAQYLKTFRLFDPILLSNKLSELKVMEVDYLDIKDISEEMVSEEDAYSYLKILEDKCGKRRVYGIGKDIIDKVLSGENQYEISLEASQELTRISSDSNIRDNATILDEALNSSYKNLIKSGYFLLDETTGGFTVGNVITIGGESGHMKTTIAIDMAFRMLEADKDVRIGIFSKEMLSEELMKKIISRQCQISMTNILNNRYDKDKVRKEIMNFEPIRNNRIKIIDPKNFHGANDIAKIQFAERFNVWFLDFIQLLDSKSSGSSDFNIEVMNNMKHLKNLSVTTESLGVVLSQIKKGVELRLKKVPTINDLEWSGVIKQLSSYVFLSYYPVKYFKNIPVMGVGEIPDNLYYLLGEKTRFSEGMVFPMQVNPSFGTFSEILDLHQVARWQRAINLM